MPTLGEFNTILRDTVRLGTRVDSLILSSVRQAVRWLERNHDFRYQIVEEIVFFNPTTQRGPYTLANTLKRIDGIFTAESVTDLTQVYWLDRVQLKDVDNFPTERPRAYDLRNDRIYLNSVPDQVYYGVVYYLKYSTFPSITTSNMYTSTDTTLWFLNNAEDLLLHQCLIQLSVPLKDAEMAALARPLRDEALHTVSASEDESKYADESSGMMYRGSYNG